MENADILSRLARGGDQKENEELQIVYRKFVVFSVAEKRYALPAEEVKEISFDNQVYYVPFLPPYIRGYANRHGAPFTVLDVQMLFDGTLLETSTLLILNIPNDQLALLISDVEEIIKIPVNEIHSITSSDDSSRYFTEAITVKEHETFILNILTLLERLEHDIERI